MKLIVGGRPIVNAFFPNNRKQHLRKGLFDEQKTFMQLAEQQ